MHGRISQAVRVQLQSRQTQKEILIGRIGDGTQINHSDERSRGGERAKDSYQGDFTIT